MTVTYGNDVENNHNPGEAADSFTMSGYVSSLANPLNVKSFKKPLNKAVKYSKKTISYSKKTCLNAIENISDLLPEGNFSTSVHLDHDAAQAKTHGDRDIFTADNPESTQHNSSTLDVSKAKRAQASREQRQRIHKIEQKISKLESQNEKLKTEQERLEKRSEHLLKANKDLQASIHDWQQRNREAVREEEAWEEDRRLRLENQKVIRGPVETHVENVSSTFTNQGRWNLAIGRGHFELTYPRYFQRASDLDARDQRELDEGMLAPPTTPSTGPVNGSKSEAGKGEKRKATMQALQRKLEMVKHQKL